MKRLFLLHIGLFALCSSPALSQDSFHNYGNIKMHDSAQIGFYQDLINDGGFDENKGLVGFYNSNSAFIKGAFRPVFEDMEIMVDEHLILEVGLGVTNNSNFISGDIITPRNLLDVNIQYFPNAFYTGEEKFTKVDGYSSISNRNDFIFPIGQFDKLRPLHVISDEIHENARSAYFHENPNFPNTFDTSFDTENRTDILLSVSTEEYWDLDANIPSKIILEWNEESNLKNFIDALENLRIVGWHTERAIWENLGNTDYDGNFDRGSITSDTFVPDDYSILTFGGSLSMASVDLDNYFISPNGDGHADFLELDAVSISPHNQLSIFNRWGRKVYEKKNYENNFEGTANVSSVYESSEKLPSGVYFYIISLYDIGLEHQGFIYLASE